VRGAFPALIAAAIVVAVLASVTIDGAWCIVWPPLLLALAVMARIVKRLT
jgi:hypothetical protein